MCEEKKSTPVPLVLEEQSQRSNSSPAAWERWVLSLDKYIDPNDQPKKHRYSIMAGFSLCIASYLLLLSIGLSNSNSLVLLVVIFLIEPVFGSFDEAGWRSDRFFKYIEEKNEREKHLSFMERYNKKQMPNLIVIAKICTPSQKRAG